MPPGGPDIEGLKALAAHNQLLADWSTRVVLLGLLAEIGVTFAYTKEKSRSEIILGVLATMVIALGVYGEVRFGSRAAQEAATLQSISDEKVAELNLKAAQLTADNLDLQEVLEPRRVFDPWLPNLSEDIVRTSQSVAEFREMRVKLQSVPNFAAETLANDLKSILANDGWKPRVVADWRESALPPASIRDGVEIWTWEPASTAGSSTANEEEPCMSQVQKGKSWYAAEALKKFLVANGVRLVTHTNIGGGQCPPDERGGIPGEPHDGGIVVTIGMKNIAMEIEILRARRARREAQ